MEFNKKNIITFIVVIILSILFIWIGYSTNKVQILDPTSENYFKAKIISIENRKVEIMEDDESVQIIVIDFKAKLLSGPNRGKTVNIEQKLDSRFPKQHEEVKQGEKIITYYEPNAEENNGQYSFVEYYRSDVLIVLGVIFVIIILVLGRSKGFFTIISLVITILAVFMVFIPAILNGRNIYLTTIVVSIFIIFMTLLLINGWNKKTLCAIVGNIGGIAVAGIITIIMSKLLRVSGFVDEEYVFLMAADLKKPLDLMGLVWSGIVIGSLGAVMDVAMSISSAMNELSENMEKKTFKKMLKSGMNIGRDAIGTMTNTLVLAYVGSSIATVLLLVMYNTNIMYLFNLEMIVVEIMQSVVGSMGILFAVPATALFASYIFTKGDKNLLYTPKDKIGGIKI